MNKKVFIILLIATLSYSSFSQRLTFVGGEFAVTSDLYEIIDPCNLLKTTPLITGSWGFTLGQEIHNNFLIETGFIRKYYYDGYGYTKYSNAIPSSNAFNSWQIPLRLKAKMNLAKNKFFLTTTVGYHFCINSEYGYGGGSGGFYHIEDNDTIISSNYTCNDSIAKTFSLIETGIGLEYIAFDGFIIYLSSAYYTGLKKVYQLDLEVEEPDCITYDAATYSKGNYWSVAIGIKYAISNFWQRKK